MAARTVIGTFVKLPRTEVLAVLATAGFDFVVCDYEHAQMDEGVVLEMVRAARAISLPTVVRIAELQRGAVNRILEAGAAGVQLARADGAASIALADVLRYPPDGSRSLSLMQAAAGYGSQPVREYVERANADVLGIGQFETADYGDALDAAVAALDVAFIGPVDLSLSLGEAGEFDGPRTRQAITAVERASRGAGTPLGIYADSHSTAVAAIERRYRYIVISSDLTMLKTGARESLGALRSSD